MRCRRRHQAALVFLIFLAPFAIAFVLYAIKPQWLYIHQTNKGQLMNPVRPLPRLNLHDAQGNQLHDTPFRTHWSLVYLGGADCNAGCKLKVFKLRNIRKLLQHNRKRLEVYYVAPNATALGRAAARFKDMPSQPHLLYAGAQPGPQAARVFRRPPGAVLTIDPNGNWVLSYKPKSTVKDIYQDLKHLLHFSHIG